nr:MAG: hypothetical protein DIU58_12340 [Sphaerobacter thermophilus]
MRLKFTGDFKALDAWAKKVKQAPEVLDKISLQLAEETIELIRDGIAQGVDPYGDPYEPLKLREGQPLRDTGRLQIWHRKASSSSGFTVQSTAKYAIYHQRGTGIYGPKKRPIKPVKAKALRIPVRGGSPIFSKQVAGTPKRRMVPERGPLPPKWRARYVETANEVLSEHFQ